MVSTSVLAAKLSKISSVEYVSEKTDIVGFNVNRGKHKCLETDVVMAIAEEEGTLYTTKDMDGCEEDYWVVL